MLRNQADRPDEDVFSLLNLHDVDSPLHADQQFNDFLRQLDENPVRNQLVKNVDDTTDKLAQLTLKQKRNTGNLNPLVAQQPSHAVSSDGNLALLTPFPNMNCEMQGEVVLHEEMRHLALSGDERFTPLVQVSEDHAFILWVNFV